MLYTIQAAELDTDAARLDHHRRSVSLYGQALPRIGESEPSAMKSPLIPEKPLEQQCRSTFSADGAIVFFPMGHVHPPHIVRRFDLRTGRELGKQFVAEGLFHYDALLPVVTTTDGKKLIIQQRSVDRKAAKSWIDQTDTESGKPAGPRIELPEPSSDRERDGRKLVSVTGNGRFVVLDLILPGESKGFQQEMVPERTFAWELASGKPLSLPTKYHRLAFSPDGRFALAVWTKSLEPSQPVQPNVVYDLTTMKPVGEPIQLPGKTVRLQLSHDGKYVIATDSSSAITLRVFEVATGRCTLARRLNNEKLPFALSPNGNLVVMQREPHNSKGVIEIRQTANGKLTQLGTTLLNSPTHLQFSPDGRYVLAMLFWDNTWQVVDTALTEPIGPPLPCASSGLSGEDWVTSRDVVFDGDSLLTRAPWPADRYLSQTQFHRWSLHPDAISLAEQKGRAELLAGRVINGAGELASIPIEEYRRRWKQAKGSHPDWFAATAPDEPKEVPTAPGVNGQPEKPSRPGSKPDYAAVFAKYGGVTSPPLVSIADALEDRATSNRIAAIDYLVFTRPDERLTLDLLAEGLKDAGIRNEVKSRFELLGQKTTPIVATLVEELATEYRHDMPTRAIVRTLGRIGPAAKDAVPMLRQYLASMPRNTYSDVETEAVRTLGRIGPDARTALPEILSKAPKYHQDSKAILILAIERILAGQESELLAPLAKQLETPKEKKDSLRSQSPREAYCELIAHFGAKLMGIESTLRKLLAEPVPEQPDAEDGERVAALEALWRVTGNVSEMLPLLDVELKRKYGTWPSHGITANGRAAAVIGRIGGAAKTLLPSLEAAVQSPNNLLDRIEIAEAIWRVSGRSDAYLAAAKAQFEEKTTYFSVDEDKIRTVRVLGELGPAVKELVPALLALAKAEADANAKYEGISITIVRQDEEDPDPNLKGKYLPVIREALRKIDPTALERLESVPKK